MTVLFSGRFDDRPHLGHLATIMALGQKYDKVIVVVLDYPEQMGDVNTRAKILKDVLSMAKGDYVVLINKEHFGYITKEQLASLPAFDVYASGNPQCSEHMKSFGYKIDECPRSYEYSGSESRAVHMITEAIRLLGFSKS